MFLCSNFHVFWLRWVFVALRGLFSLVAASGGYSSLWASHCGGFSCCEAWPLGFSTWSTWARQLWLAGSRAQAQQVWLTGLVALLHVGSSRARYWTCVPCTGRWTSNYCATREVPKLYFYLGHLYKMECVFVLYQIYITKQRRYCICIHLHMRECDHIFTKKRLLN